MTYRGLALRTHRVPLAPVRSPSAGRGVHEDRLPCGGVIQMGRQRQVRKSFMAAYSQVPQRATLTPPAPEVVCWEAIHPHGRALRRARRIYKACLPDDERIPWSWLKEGLDRERVWHPERWSCHLLLAGLRRLGEKERRVMGFAYGALVPGFGGYGGYLAVDPRFRGRGVGARLWRLLIQRLQLDAACAGVPLPFVLWESRAPAADAGPHDQAVWRSRLGLWARVGAYRIGGVHFLTPNFADDQGPPVALQLFLKPVDLPLAAFDAGLLRSLVSALHQNVYNLDRDDPLSAASLPRSLQPMLQPLTSPDADRRRRP